MGCDLFLQTDQETILFAFLTKASWSIHGNSVVVPRIAGRMLQTTVKFLPMWNSKPLWSCMAYYALKKKGSSFLGLNINTMAIIHLNQTKPLVKVLFPFKTVQYNIEILTVNSVSRIAMIMRLLYAEGIKQVKHPTQWAKKKKKKTSLRQVCVCWSLLRKIFRSSLLSQVTVVERGLQWPLWGQSTASMSKDSICSSVINLLPDSFQTMTLTSRLTSFYVK